MATNSTSATAYSQDVSKEILSRLIAEQQQIGDGAPPKQNNVKSGFCPDLPDYLETQGGLDIFYQCPEVTMDGHDVDSLVLPVKDLAFEGISRKTTLYNYFETLKKMSDLLGGVQSDQVFCNNVWDSIAQVYVAETCPVADDLMGRLAYLTMPLPPDKFELFVRSVFTDPLVTDNLALVNMIVSMMSGEGLNDPANWPLFKTNLYQTITLFKTLPHAFAPQEHPAIPFQAIDWRDIKPGTMGAKMGIAIAEHIKHMKDSDYVSLNEYFSTMHNVCIFLNQVYEIDIMRGKTTAEGLIVPLLSNLTADTIENIIVYSDNNASPLCNGLWEILTQYQNQLTQTRKQ